MNTENKLDAGETQFFAAADTAMLKHLEMESHNYWSVV